MSEANVLRQVSELYNAYDGSMPWMDFVRSSSVGQDVRLEACRIHPIKAPVHPNWPLFTLWAPFMEKIPLIDEIWQFWCSQADEEDIRQYEAGAIEITQIDQWRGGEYWLVESQRYGNRCLSTLKRVNGKITAWRDEEAA